jgi:pimeloyl-ACP methyl ester carboxylesterase
MTSRESGPEPFSRRRVLVLAGAALAASGCSRETEAAMTAPLEPMIEERALAIDGQRLTLLQASPARGAHRRPVVLIHGASGNARDWTFGAMQAIARDHPVVAFDRPGLGGSDAPETGVESPFVQAARMRAGLDALGLADPILVGHSYGGSVALAWALAEPGRVRGLVLLAAPSQVWPGGLGLATDLLASDLLGPVVARTAALLPRGLIDGAAARVFEPQEKPVGYIDRLGPARVTDPAVLRANARQLAALKGYITAMVPRYPGLAMPVALLHGDADTIVPLAIHSEPLATQIAGARLEVLPGIGHMPHHAAPDALMAALAETRARA